MSGEWLRLCVIVGKVVFKMVVFSVCIKKVIVVIYGRLVMLCVFLLVI